MKIYGVITVVYGDKNESFLIEVDTETLKFSLEDSYGWDEDEAQREADRLNALQVVK